MSKSSLNFIVHSGDREELQSEGHVAHGNRGRKCVIRLVVHESLKTGHWEAVNICNKHRIRKGEENTKQETKEGTAQHGSEKTHELSEADDCCITTSEKYFWPEILLDQSKLPCDVCRLLDTGRFVPRLEEQRLFRDTFFAMLQILQQEDLNAEGLIDWALQTIPHDRALNGLKNRIDEFRKLKKSLEEHFVYCHAEKVEGDKHWIGEAIKSVKAQDLETTEHLGDSCQHEVQTHTTSVQGLESKSTVEDHITDFHEHLFNEVRKAYKDIELDIWSRGLETLENNLVKRLGECALYLLPTFRKRVCMVPMRKRVTISEPKPIDEAPRPAIENHSTAADKKWSPRELYEMSYEKTRPKSKVTFASYHAR